jgi:hypothetical protein
VEGDRRLLKWLTGPMFALQARWDPLASVALGLRMTKYLLAAIALGVLLAGAASGQDIPAAPLWLASDENKFYIVSL